MPPQQDQVNGVTGEDHSPPGQPAPLQDAVQFHQIPLEVLLTSPIFWRGQKCCQFLTTAHNLIKDEKELTEFKIKLDSDHNTSSVWDLWSGQPNWKDVLGDEIFSVATVFTHHGEGNTSSPKVRKNSGQKCKPSSVIDLLRVIRNKMIHSADFRPVEKEKLNWHRYDAVEDKYYFSENLFATFWTTKFPQLQSYLWWQYRRYRDSKDVSMEKVYPFPVETAHEQLMLFPQQLCGALQNHLENGSMEARYLIKNGDMSSTLEFRTLPRKLVDTLLDESCSVEISVTKHQIICRWFGNEKACVVGERVTNLDVSNHNDISLFEGNIIVAHEVGHLNFDTIEKVIMESDHSLVGNRIIIFTNSCNTSEKASVDALVRNMLKQRECDISEIQVNWNDLSDSIKSVVLNERELRIQNKIIKLGEILFGDDEEDKNKVLSHLKGDLLNQFLRSRQPVLLAKLLELPQETELYVSRRLSRYMDLNGPEYITNVFPDLTVVMNITLQTLARILPSDTITIVSAEDLWPKIQNSLDFQVFLLNGDISDLNVFGEVTEEENVRIHCLRHFRGKQFEFLGIIDFHSTQDDLCAVTNVANVGREMEETDFIESVNSQGPIFIADKPGMGKSLCLTRLSRQISRQFGNRLVVFRLITQFIDQVEKENLTKKCVINALFQLLNANEFEMKLAHFLLSGSGAKSSGRKISFEILLDGLDEVGMDKRELAAHSLNLLSEIPSIRLWVSLRDHMVDSVSKLVKGFNYSNLYKLIQFSEETQINFLVEYWLQRNRDGVTLTDSEDLRIFARKCVQIPFSKQDAQIVGIPLHCKMLAEIYESKVVEGDFSWDETSTPSLVDLYEKLLETKLEIYVREKKGICKSTIPLNDSIFDYLRDQFELSHFYCALTLIMGSKVANLFQNRLLVTARNISRLAQRVQEQGVIQKIDTLTFVHRTLAEFIVALFVVKVLSDQLLTISSDDSDFKNVLWDDMLIVHWHLDDCDEEEDDYNLSYGIEVPYPAVTHFVNALWEQNSIASGKEDTSKFENLLKSLQYQDFPDWTIGYSKLLRSASMLHIAQRHDWKGIMSICLKSQPHLLGVLAVSLFNQKWELVKYLISNYLKETWTRLQNYNESGFGVFHHVIASVRRGNLQWNGVEMTHILRWMMENDSSLLEQRDSNGCTALLLLLKIVCEDRVGRSHDKCLEFIKILVTELKADVHAVDNDKNTVLHYIGKVDQNYDSDYEEWLMRNGEPDYKAKLEIYMKILKYFMESGCTVKMLNTKNSKGHTPLYTCVQEFGELVIGSLKTFREYGADFNLQDNEGRTVLHVSTEKWLSVEFIRELIACGADISVENQEGKNCFELALIKGNAEV